MTDEIRVLRSGTCPSLSGKFKLTYDIGGDTTSRIHVRIVKNTGGGLFHRDWVALDRVPPLVADRPITSGTLAPLFKGGSANSAGFLLAVMKHEGLVQPSADRPRCYVRLDGKAFFAEIKALMGSTPKKSARAPATKQESPPKASHQGPYVTEVHGRSSPSPRSLPSADNRRCKAGKGGGRPSLSPQLFTSGHLQAHEAQRFRGGLPFAGGNAELIPRPTGFTGFTAFHTHKSEECQAALAVFLLLVPCSSSCWWEDERSISPTLAERKSHHGTE